MNPRTRAKSSLSLSDRMRATGARDGRRAWENYVNGNRSDARNILRASADADIVVLTVAEFVRIGGVDAVAFLDSFADF